MNLSSGPSETRSPSDQPTASEAGLPPHLLGKLKIEIPGYELLDEIARGGQATVYRARELTSGLTVAIKLLHAGPYANEASRQRLQREIAALKALNHPNIVCVIEAGQTGTGLDYLVMNYIEGRGLDEFWRDRKTLDAEADDPSKLLRLFQQICETMAAAHRKGITHRDLSPSNIRIDEHGTAHILDFGLASTAFDGYLTPGGKELSITGQFIGKLAYASPEQAKGDRGQIDIRTDVYALGVILYQILTHGAFPYEVVGNLVDVLNNIIHSKPTPPSQIVDQAKAARASASVKLRKKRIDPTAINATIEAIVLKALEKNPDDRYQSAGELAREIEQYLRGKPLTAPPVPSKPKKDSRRLTILIATTSLVILLGAFMYGRTVAALLGFSSLLSAAPTSQPSTQPAEAPGRIEFKTIELASTETSIDAINRSLRAAGYAVAVANNKANQYDQGNIDMNRNGGGPVDWRSFYGKTVKDFSSTNIVGNRQAYRRPPQFNYIYQANNQEKGKLEKDVSALGKQIDTLLERRRQLESNQLSLWATIAWQAVDDRGIALEPTLRYRPKSVTGGASRLQTFVAAQTFLLAENAALESGLENVSADPGKALTALNDSTKSAYNTFRAAMADATAGLTDADDQKIAGQLADTAKHLFDLTRNAVDAQKLAMERDGAKDDQGKNTFRGQLQAAIFDSCTAVCSLDDQLNAAAKAWQILPGTTAIAKPVNNGSSPPPAVAKGSGPIPALTVGSQWVGTDENTLNNAQNRMRASIVAVDGNVVTFRTDPNPDPSDRFNGFHQHDWKLIVAPDGSITCSEAAHAGPNPSNNFTNVKFTGKMVGEVLRLEGTYDNGGHPSHSVIAVRPASAESTAPAPASPSGFVWQVDSKWTATDANTVMHNAGNVTGAVVAVDSRVVTLRVASSTGVYNWKLNLGADGTITCTSVEKHSGGGAVDIADINMTGGVSDGVLKLTGSIRWKVRRNQNNKNNEVLALRLDTRSETSSPGNVTPPASVLTQGPGQTAFAAETLRNTSTDADGAIGVKHLSTLAFEGADGRDFVLTGEAYFSSAAEAMDGPMRKGLCFYFRQSDNLHRFELNRMSLTAKRIKPDGTSTDGPQSYGELNLPTDRWVNVRVAVSAAELSVQLDNKTASIPGPIKSSGTSGVVMQPGSKLRNMKLTFTN